jgi:hypothetical protein
LTLANLKQAREAEPYLAKFEDDWATGQILRQYINGKRKYENAKANEKVKVGVKRKSTSPPSPSAHKRAKRLPNSPSDEEIGRRSDDNSGSSEDDEDEWTGIGNHSH